MPTSPDSVKHFDFASFHDPTCDQEDTCSILSDDTTVVVSNISGMNARNEANYRQAARSILEPFNQTCDRVWIITSLKSQFWRGNNDLVLNILQKCLNDKFNHNFMNERHFLSWQQWLEDITESQDQKKFLEVMDAINMKMALHASGAENADEQSQPKSELSQSQDGSAGDRSLSENRDMTSNSGSDSVGAVRPRRREALFLQPAAEAHPIPRMNRGGLLAGSNEEHAEAGAILQEEAGEALNNLENPVPPGGDHWWVGTPGLDDDESIRNISNLLLPPSQHQEQEQNETNDQKCGFCSWLRFLFR